MSSDGVVQPRAVVLAAGDGGRLGPHTTYTPKPLVELGGRRIIDYTLESLRAAGVKEALVVTGYRSEQVMEALSGEHRSHPGLEFAHNPGFEGGAARSLLAAREYAGDDSFLLVMSDHILGADLIRALLSATEAGSNAVGADFLRGRSHAATYVQEATKLRVAETGHVTAIGKDLAEWQALDTGAFFCSPGTWDAVAACEPDAELSDVFAVLARRRELVVADVSGCFWYDIDTDADLRAAGELLGAVHGV